MLVTAEAEWNFVYLLLQDIAPTKLKISNALQIRWQESPGFFYLASEMACGVAAELVGFNDKVHDLTAQKSKHPIYQPVAKKSTAVDTDIRATSNPLGGD